MNFDGAFPQDISLAHSEFFDALQENRRDYRELFLTAPGICEYLSGCILYKETLYQSSTDGKAFVEILTEGGILVGIKVDEVCLEH